ncbi:MAG TPA: hypothetical protein VEL28_05635 [Candidatus Binatia bacterium]|nr:hypothetical protein [Candidatus Binatia bacterium]
MQPKRKISSRSTVVNKKIVPALWFIFLAVFVITGIVRGKATENPAFLLIPTLMAVAGFVTTRKLVWDLADEVFDYGDHLLVRKGNEQERIALSNVINVSISSLINPPRITLRLATPGRFGNEVAFSPSVGLRINPFAKIAVGEDLIARVDEARATRTR